MKANYNCGSIQMQVRDASNNISFPVLVHYPTSSQNIKPTAFGPYTMDVSVDAIVAEGSFPLVIISHGNSGSHLIYRTISIYLAKHGYIVAMLEHYGNNRNNNALEKSIENLQYRPLHISLTIDAVVNDEWFIGGARANDVAVIGHSFGGYSALAVAGGQPWTMNGEQVKVKHDDRVKALVLLAPATGWFNAPGALHHINVPILMLMAEHDPYAPAMNAEIVLKGVPDASKVILRTIKSAGHYAFLSPFPPQLHNPGFAPASDPDGFDRQKFHETLPVEIDRFLKLVQLMKFK